MPSKRFNVSMDTKLMARIDREAKRRFTSRSDFLRIAALHELKGRGARNFLRRFFGKFLAK